jgi:hypothetical protein
MHLLKHPLHKNYQAYCITNLNTILVLNVTNTNNKAYYTNIQARTGNRPNGLEPERGRVKRARARTDTS